MSVERARERLGDCRSVLERHGARVRGRAVFCPLHPNERTPAGSLYASGEKSRYHCHGCDFDGDVLDLEAALSGRALGDVIRDWGRS